MAHSSATAVAQVSAITDYQLPSQLQSRLSKDNLYKDLERLYPYFDDAELKAKLSAIADPFMMFRSLVPYFFDLLNTDEVFEKDFKSLLKPREWILGDLHPENFGILLNSEGKAFYQMNDPDDAGMGPLAMEVFRYFVALELLKRRGDYQYDAQEIFGSYLKGLQDEAHELPEFLKVLFAKSEKDGREPKKSQYSKKSLTLKEDEEKTRLNDDALAYDLKRVLAHKFPNAEFKDFLVLNRATGGSAYLKRFRVLLSFKDQPKDLDSSLQIFELKEIADAGVAPLETSRERRLKTTERLERSFAKMFSDHKPAYYSSINFGRKTKSKNLKSKTFYIRPRWDALNSVTLSEQSPEHRPDLLAYQAWIIGSNHRQLLKTFQRAVWVRSWKKTDFKYWNAAAQAYADYYEKLFVLSR